MPGELHFSARDAASLQDRATSEWHREVELDPPADPFLSTVLAQHRANFDLWHTEDRARAPQAKDADIVEVKRAIDRRLIEVNDEGAYNGHVPVTAINSVIGLIVAELVPDHT